MKKTLLNLALLCLPFLAFAQDPVLYKDFATSIRTISSIHFSDELSVMLINVDNQSFDVLGVNQDMAIVWKTSFSGYPLSLAKFNGKIIAIAATERSAMKGVNSTYNGFLINPQTGDKEIEKVVFEDSPDFMDYPKFLINKDTFWGICIRQSNAKRKIHVGLPGPFALISIAKVSNEIEATQDMTIVQLDEKLEPKNSFKPAFDKGATFVDADVNDHGDVFIAWLNNKAITINRYEYEKKQLSNSVKMDVAFRDGWFSNGVTAHLAPSSANRNMAYCGLFYADEENSGKKTLSINNIDFSTGQKKTVTEVFDRDHIKAIEKAFIKPNKKISDPDFGSLKSFRIRYFEEIDGSLVVAMASGSSESESSGRSSTDQFAVALNGYDNDLNLKFQQVVPASYNAPKALPLGFYPRNHKLYVIANDKSGMMTFNALYGALDLTTGQWDSMLRLSKKKIDNSDYPDGSAALWFANTFALPYMSPKGLGATKNDVLLQQNSY